MQKLTILAAGVAICTTGCQMTAPSKTWETVRSVPKTGSGVKDRSGTYADRLHKLLQQAGIEHKVVTFTFRYPTSMMVDAPAQDTAVIYKDSASPDHPWWLAAESLWSPMWLPTQSLGRQIDFYLARPSAVVSVAEYPAAKVRRHRTKTDHAARKAKSHSETAGQTSEKMTPPADKEPAPQPAPVGQGPATSTPGAAPTPVGNPPGAAPEKAVPKTEPPPRPAPPKTVPVFLDLAPAPIACPANRAGEFFLNA